MLVITIWSDRKSLGWMATRDGNVVAEDEAICNGESYIQSATEVLGSLDRRLAEARRKNEPVQFSPPNHEPRGGIPC